MQMMELVIQNLLLFYFIVTYLGICAGLMITENLLIRRGNRRGLLLFLLLVGVLSFGIFAACPVSSTAAPRDIVKMEVKSNGSTTGMQIAMIERSAGNAKKELIALGELVLQEDDNSRYLTVRAEHGKFICEDAQEYAETIAQTMRVQKVKTDGFSGQSCSYRELLAKMGEAAPNADGLPWAAVLKAGLTFLPELILILRWLLVSRKRKKEQLLKKMKLTDL